MESLAGKAPYLNGVGVAINREMYVWEGHHENDTPLCKAKITAWNGYMFCEGNITYKHACELPAVDENSFVRDGVRYVAEEREDSLCGECACFKNKLNPNFNDPRATTDIGVYAFSYTKCTEKNGVSCHKSERKDGRSIRWAIANKPRAMSSVEIAKRYGKGGYAFTYSAYLKSFHTDIDNICSITGICLIDDLCEDVSKSPWFMPMVDESGTVTEQRV